MILVLGVGDGPVFGGIGEGVVGIALDGRCFIVRMPLIRRIRG